MATTPPIKVPILGVDKYSKEFKKLSKNVEKVGKGFQKVGRFTTRFVTAPILAGGVASMKFARDLNRSMANVGTMIPNQIERLTGMKKAVMDLAVQTGTSSQLISEGLYQVISAFGGAEDPMVKLNLATKMSKAGLATVTDSINLVSAVTKGYGDTSDEAAQKVSDMSFLTVKLGQTTFPELAASIGKAVPFFTTLKVKQTELFGAMATLTGVTGNAAEVSTQLRAAMGSFIKPSSQMTKAAKQLGYESSIAMVKEIGFAKSIQLLGDKVGMNEIKLGQLFTRKEGLNAVLTLLGPQAENFAMKTVEMGKAAGATDDAFRQQTQGIDKSGFTWDTMMERLKRSAVIIGDKLIPVVERIVIKLEPYVDTIASASDETLEFGIKVAAGAAAVGPFLIILGKVIAVGPTLLGFMASWKASLIASKTATLGTTLATTKFTNVMELNTKTTKGAILANKGYTVSQQNLRTAAQKTNVTLGNSIKQAGILNSTLSVLAAGQFGWAIGTLIYKNVVKPLMDSVFHSQKANEAMKDLSGEKIDMWSTGALKNKAAILKKEIAAEREGLKGLNASAGAYGAIPMKSTKRLDQMVAQLERVQGRIKNDEERTRFKKAGGFTDVVGGRSVLGTEGSAGAAFDAMMLNQAIGAQGGMSKIEIDFKNLPEGASASVKETTGNSKVRAKGRGKTMDGTF